MRRLFSLIIFLYISLNASLSLASPDFKLIQNHALLANGTYLENAQLLPVLEQQSRVLIHQATFVDSQVSFYLSANEELQTIAIRGTANLQNVMVNLNLALQTDASLGISLHQGFAKAARDVYEEVKPFLEEGKPITTTGHSLGGAIAVILAMYLESDGYNLQQVITFGQPKVTNVNGAKQFIALPLIRVVTPDDIVPLVPPLSPLQIKDLDIFWHMGDEMILQGKHQYAMTSGIKSMLRATKFSQQLPNESNLIAHKMVTYLQKLAELMTNPVEKPYKTNINLFGFSLDS